jgi:Cof subfamily protein (haloacid dehalogenase superfamily)
MTRISCLLSDVDGTLVTPDKRLTEATCAVVRELHGRGIAFTVTSSRPPLGLRMLIEPLHLQLPMGAYNGGAIVGPDLCVIEERFIPPDAAREAVEFLSRFVDVWLFSGPTWFVRNPAGAYVDLERRTVQFEPTIVPAFGAVLCRAAKIVGVSADFAQLAYCEGELRQRLGDQASVARSQNYYLDVTHPQADKGHVVEALSRLLSIPASAIATIGDGRNDVAMFRAGGLSIAMGNAAHEVQAQAAFVTDGNDADGFAKAVEKYLLAAVDAQRGAPE